MPRVSETTSPISTLNEIGIPCPVLPDQVPSYVLTAFAV